MLYNFGSFGFGMGIIGLNYDFGSPYMHLGKSCVAPNVAHHLNNFVNNN